MKLQDVEGKETVAKGIHVCQSHYIPSTSTIHMATHG